MRRIDIERACLTRRTLLAGGAALLSATSTLFSAEATAGKFMAGKTVLITGSTDGLGRLVAKQLADAGAFVLVHGRNRERGAAVVKQIEAAGGKAKLYVADLSSLAEVRKLAQSVRRDHQKLHLLINNAGIGSVGSGGARARETSADGHELRFAVNYLAGVLLTRELLPTILNSAPARIVNVASLGQRALDFDNIMLEREYDGSRAYSQSKLAQIMFTIDLAEELAGKNVTVNSLHPATYMNTTMVLQAGAQPRSTVEEGAAAVMYVATSPQLEGKSGLFFNGKQEARANEQAYDAAARAKLKALSERLTQA